MKQRTIGYWAATVLTIAAFAFGGFADLAAPPEMVQGFDKLGYPAYLLTLLGVWKVAGAIVVAVPGLPRLKEWAYAGMLFDFTGAAYSHAAAGDPTDKIVTPLVLLAIVLTSWALRPSSRKLESKAQSSDKKESASAATAIAAAESRASGSSRT